MGAYHMIVSNPSTGARRVDFHAETAEQAFLMARNEKDGVEVELWEGERCLACMTKTIANVWRLGKPGSADRAVS